MADPTRDELIKELATASLTGTLGLFVGAGCSKAITGNNAPNWAALLKILAQEHELNDPQSAPEKIVGWSYPAIAANLVAQLAELLLKEARFAKTDLNERRMEAVRRLKLEVARQTAKLTPDKSLANGFREALLGVAASWIITTNYDYLLEELLPHTETLLQGQIFRSRQGNIPVYHIHGHLRHPDSIVLFEDDYVRALDHSRYGHLRLSVLLAESTTLMIGYGFGDTNIQTALSYARGYQSSVVELRTNDVGRLVVLNRNKTPSASASVGQFGEAVVEAAEIVDFLREIAAERNALEKHWNGVKSHINTMMAEDEKYGPKFVKDEKYRKDLLAALREIPALLDAGSAVAFIETALTHVSTNARKADGWKQYAVWLNVVLDIFENWPLGSMPPQLFEYICRELRRLAHYIEPDGNDILGFAFEATTLWHNRKTAIFGDRQELLSALRSYAERSDSISLDALLKSVA